ncbi:hypothetical protein ALI144C_06590 [Actinosynnema sp. ALI-1.44]|uniref:class I SAM-dependent methyltransferase n=1 Tax=Actinosynnema sp. ALI-1.44 TaxID=1933779 RepID=UPI00097C3440|nr:class I SAM-dependent methyltransferase [Actinosynnema sp. ALI-1.44]ONI88681.1 hypothetical protein ALI144C_06590 [Actinosynnema sp. ALI-1.44]
MGDASLFDKALGDPASTLYMELEHSDLPPNAQPVGWWRREPGAVAPPDIDALDWVREGYVLDIGCSTGRHLEILAERGVRGHGIDTSAAAVALAALAGVEVVHADVNQYVPPADVDVVLALGGTGGICGTVEALPAFLSRMAGWLGPDGTIVFTSADWRRLSGLDDGSGWTTRRYPGDWRMRFRLGEQVGPWFPWLVVDIDTLARVCGQVGLRIEQRKLWMGGTIYAALLKRCSGA